jgi:hypothetical protein
MTGAVKRALLAAAALIVAAAPAPAAAVEKIAVLVLPASERDQATADNLTEVVIARIAARAAFEIVGTGEFRRRMEVRDDRQAQLCLDQTSCADRVAVSLGVTRIVSGSVGARESGRYLFSLAMRNVASGQIQARVFRLVEGSIADLVRSAQQAADDLFVSRPEPGRVHVQSTLPGARVWINEAYVGLAPVISGNLVPGPHLVRVQKAGHFPWSSSVEVPAGASLEIELSETNLPRRLAWPRPAAWGTAAGAVATLAGAFVLSIVANVDPTEKERGKAQQQFEQHRRLGGISQILFGGGIVLSLSSAYLFWKYDDHIFERER